MLPQLKNKFEGSFYDVSIDNKIKIAQEEHREKYFNDWRTIDVDEYIAEIKKQSELLDKRFNLLVNIVKFEDSNITE